MPRIFRQRDIDQMQASDVSQEFVDYYNRLSEERKSALAESRPDLHSVLLAWHNDSVDSSERETHVDESLDKSSGTDSSDQTNNETVVPSNDSFGEICNNAYENISIPQIMKDDLRPVEALTIDDNQIKCPAHRTLLTEYNPRFHKLDGSILGMIFYHCPECNRLFIKHSRYEKNHMMLDEWAVPHKFYDYELSKKYLLSQTKPYELVENEKIYVPDMWIEENPACPIHGCLLVEMPCIRQYKAKSVSFTAYYCDECKKVVLRRSGMLNLDDQCAEAGIPLIQHELLAKKTPPTAAIPKREIKPDYIMNEGKRDKYAFNQITDCYKLSEQDTIVVSDSLYCNIDGHDTETVLGLIWVKERNGNRKSYLFMLGYCSECQKYYMDETDYKTIYGIGRLEATVLLDIDNNTYMASSGDVFDIERKHLDALENSINKEIAIIHNQPDYMNPYAAQSYYDDGGLAYAKAVSREKYEGHLEELSSFKPRPYEYRVDISTDGKNEVYYIGSTDIHLNEQQQVISANSSLGRQLVHYQTIKVKKNGFEYGIKLSRQFDINNATLFGYTNLRTDEDIIFRSGITDPFLVRVLNMRKKQHNLIDIFVTIQENQNAIVDARFDKSIIVQGCAGSGKTMVLLHRLSSLKYNKANFDFNHDALILTPNDNFSLHIKGLAENLQIGSISRSSVEQYYADMLVGYSKEFALNGKVSSEMFVKQVFVDYIYSDDFRYCFEKNYIQVIAARNQLIDCIHVLVEQMGEPIKPIDISEDYRVIPQVKAVVDTLANKVDANEKRISDTERVLSEHKNEKDILAIEIPQKRQAVSDRLKNELFTKASAKALAALDAIQDGISIKQNQLQKLESDRISLERLMLSSIDVVVFEDYLEQNREWQEPQLTEKLVIISEYKKSISEKLADKTRIAAILTIPPEELFTLAITYDSDIAWLLGELANERKKLDQLQKDKASAEGGWIAFGKSRRLVGIKNQIEEILGSISLYEKTILETLDERRAQLLQIEADIAQLIVKIEASKTEVINSVERKKKSRLDSIKRQITKLSMTIESDADKLKKNTSILNAQSENMSDLDYFEWLSNVSVFAPTIKVQIRIYNRLQTEIQQQENTYSGMDERIATAQSHYDVALSERYSDSIRESVRQLQQAATSYSTLSTYQMVFDSTVTPFKEKHGIKSINGRYHRYDLYAQLVFAMKFYGKVAGHVKLMCVDEGQDLAINEYRLFYELNSHDVTFNIFGDTNQLIKDNRGISDWSSLKRIFDAELYTLNENYRNTNQITRFCNDSFGMIMHQTGVDGAKVREITKREFDSEVSNLHITTERVAILLPRGVQKRKYLSLEALSSEVRSIVGEEIAVGKIAVMYVDEVKGIEFDKVYVIPNKMGRNEKYIAYTRALSELIIVVDDGVQAYDDDRLVTDT